MSIGKVGRYQLRGEIGRGGMATVQKALDPNSDREVAIKLLPREMLHNPAFRVRFKRELNTISALEHPAIVPVYDSGEEDGQPYFVMRYMTGGSLAGRLKHGRLSLEETVIIIEKLALALDYAHQKGIIHRDLKPDNILFDADGNPYLSDFGVAKLVEAAFSETGSGIVGTPAYVSPEQAGGENDRIDHRSDVYGLGVLVYQMLTGVQPYRADTPMGVLVKHIHEPVPNILEDNPDLPPSLELILKTAMEKRREDRYQSVLEFARALSVAAFGPERTMPSALVLERKRATLSARKGAALMIGGAVFLLILAGAYFALPNFKPSPTPTPTVTASRVPSITPSITTTVSPTSTVSIPTVTLIPTVELPTMIPTPDGGADRLALLSGNTVVSMNLDGSNPVVIDPLNIEKSNLQWIADGRLVYLSPTRNCAYIVDVENKAAREVLCFNLAEKLEGFRVSPDEKHVAISVARVLYIVPFDVEQFKGIDTRFLLGRLKNSCFYSLPVKDVRWSRDGRRIAAMVVDTQQAGSDQIHLFEVDFQNCNSNILVPVDRFPANLFTFGSTTIPSYDWDGDNQFLLNDFLRNGGFGNLYLYNSKERVGKMINPINQGACCYRDARWSPDGKYILFLYRDEFGGEVKTYYIPASDLGKNDTWDPVELAPGLLKPLDPPQPALQPFQ